MEQAAPEYQIDHIGLNCPGDEAARVAEQLCRAFGLCPNRETQTHVFAGDLFEVKKNLDRGKYGHIALRTSSIETAIQHLKQNGIKIRENSIRRTEDGRIKFVYLDLEIAGFAFHLTL